MVLFRHPAKDGKHGVSEQGDSLEAVRREKLRAIEALGIDPWGHRFDNHHPVAKVRELPVDPANPEHRHPTRIAGRIVLRRVMGNVHFLDIQDATGRVQVMIGKKQVGETGWKLAALLDLGDLLGVDGAFGLTKTGEKTVFATAITMLGKIGRASCRERVFRTV